MATLEARLEAKKFFSCFDCCAKYKKKPEIVERRRKSKGCYDLNTRQYLVENVVYKGCVGNFTTNIEFLMEAYTAYTKGMLPFSGELSDQPAKIIDLFGIVQQRIEDHKTTE